MQFSWLRFTYLYSTVAFAAGEHSHLFSCVTAIKFSTGRQSHTGECLLSRKSRTIRGNLAVQKSGREHCLHVFPTEIKCVNFLREWSQGRGSCLAERGPVRCCQFLDICYING